MKKSNVIFSTIFVLFFVISVALAHESRDGYHAFTCNPYVYGGNYAGTLYPPYKHSPSCLASDTSDRCFPYYLARENREWLDIGPDPANPYLDPLLWKHSFYADSSLDSRNGWTFPGSGYSGTAGSVMNTPVTINKTNSCGDAPQSFIQNINSDASASVASGNSLQWGNGTTPTGSGIKTQVPVVYPVKPRFPDIRRDSFFHDSARVLVVPGSGITLGKGAHFYKKIEICSGTINMTVGKKGEKTILYLSDYESFKATCDGNILIQAVTEEGVPVPSPVDCESSEYGQAMIIARGCIVKTSGDAGQFYIDVPIITLSQFMIRGNSRFTGQVIGDRLTTSGIGTASAAIANMTFAPIKTYQLDVPPATFGESKYWAWRTSGCDFEGDDTKSTPKYYNTIYSGAPYAGDAEIEKPDEDYYDTTIAVSLADPITEGSIEVKWKIKYQQGIIEPLKDGNLDARMLVGGKLEDGYIVGNVKFESGKNSKDVDLRIIDKDEGVDKEFVMEFEVVSVSPENYLNNNLMPTTITVKSDNDCTPVEDPTFPTIKWAAIYGDSTGEPITIRAEIENIDELDGTEECSFSWGTTTAKKKIADNKISTNGDIMEFDITGLSQKGGGSGKLFIGDYSFALTDSCAPAIRNANYFRDESKKFDTIAISFTEKIDVLPFVGFDGKPSMTNTAFLAFAKDKKGKNADISLIQAKVISVDEEKGAWRFLYKSDEITDDKGNLLYSYVKIIPRKDMDNFGGVMDVSSEQNAPLDNNHWVAIDFEPKTNFHTVDITLSNAAYFSNSNPADGFIDLIKADIDINFKPESDFNQMESEDKIKELLARMTLPASREFNKLTANDITINGNSLEISVSPKKDGLVSSKTSVDEDDIIKINEKLDISDTVEIVVEGNIEIADSIAPVIVKARFEPMEIQNEDDDIVDILILWFSESLKNPVRKDALVLKSGKKFKFDDAKISGDYIKIPIKYNESSYLPKEGDDSIRVEGGFDIIDLSKNLQKINTVFVPLEVGKYKQNYEVLVHSPYNLKEDDMLRIMVVPIKSRGDKNEDALSGNIVVIDNLGNNVVNMQNFVPNKKGSGLIWTWDGKNSRGRNVGAGMYQAIITITDELEKTTQTFMKKVGIKN